MAEVMKKATRDSYGEALVELGQENPNIVAVSYTHLTLPTKLEV